MADPAAAQETGGGEGAVSPATTASDISSQAAKSVDTVVAEQQEAKKDAAPAAVEPVPVSIEKNTSGPAEVKVIEEKVAVPAEVKAVEEKASVPIEVKATEGNAPISSEVKATEDKTPVLTEVKATEEKAQVPTEVKATEDKAPVSTEIKDEPKPNLEAVLDAKKVEQSNGVLNKTDDWQKRESELLKKIEELETVKNERSEDGIKLELKVREEEIDLLKTRVRNLETELQAAMSKPSGKNHEMIENIKQQHEELLSKARGMIFDKTKMVKNQELQIEALSTQVQSLKDINQITKDLLEIRNSEIKAMEDRLQAMEERFKKEKERFGLVLQRAQTSTNINDDLRKEYETQLAIFKELREKYEQRVQALAAENKRLKEVHEAREAVRNAQAGAGGSG